MKKTIALILLIAIFTTTLYAAPMGLDTSVSNFSFNPNQSGAANTLLNLSANSFFETIPHSSEQLDFNITKYATRYENQRLSFSGRGIVWGAIVLAGGIGMAIAGSNMTSPNAAGNNTLTTGGAWLTVGGVLIASAGAGLLIGGLITLNR